MEATSSQYQVLAAAGMAMAYGTPPPLVTDRCRDPTQNFSASTHISAVLPSTSRGRASATSGILLIERNGLDGSLSLQKAMRDPATNDSRCGGRRKGEEEVSGLRWMGVSHPEEPQHHRHAHPSAQGKGCPASRELSPTSQLQAKEQNPWLVPQRNITILH